ncbi:MAG: asparagine synthetase [Candidatus Thiodiazotropha sp. DIVDIV]
MIRIKYIFIPFFILLTACQTLGEHKRAETLENVLRRYEASVRWTSGQQVHNFLPPDHKDKDYKPVSRNLKVTHYEVVQGPTMLGEDLAIQTVIIQFVFQDTQVLKELSDKQEWRYDEEAETWHLYSPVPEYK